MAKYALSNFFLRFSVIFACFLLFSFIFTVTHFEKTRNPKGKKSTNCILFDASG